MKVRVLFSESAGAFSDLPMRKLNNKQLKRIARRGDSRTSRYANSLIEDGKRDQRHAVSVKKELLNLLQQVNIRFTEMEMIEIKDQASYRKYEAARKRVDDLYEEMAELAAENDFRLYDFDDPKQWMMPTDNVVRDYRAQQRARKNVDRVGSSKRMQNFLKGKLEELREQLASGETPAHPNLDISDLDSLEKYFETRKMTPDEMTRVSKRIGQFQRAFVRSLTQ